MEKKSQEKQIKTEASYSIILLLTFFFFLVFSLKWLPKSRRHENNIQSHSAINLSLLKINITSTLHDFCHRRSSLSKTTLSYCHGGMIKTSVEIEKWFFSHLLQLKMSTVLLFSAFIYVAVQRSNVISSYVYYHSEYNVAHFLQFKKP